MHTRTASLVAALAILFFTVNTPTAHAQGYDGVVADDGSASGAGSDVFNPARGYNPDIYKSDYYAERAAGAAAEHEALRGALKEQRAAAISARAEAAKAAQKAIDARVKAAVTSPSTYGSRLDGLKTPVTQVPPTVPTPPSVTPPTQPTLPGGGGTSPGGGGNDHGGGRSVLENMMNAIQ